jgi:hypothetical protein
MIEDDLDNWLRWGNLINDWINNNPAKPRPTTVAELKTAMAGDGVIGIVEGPDDRVVTLVDYLDGQDQPITILLPAATMVQRDEQELDEIAMRPPGQRRYPLPVFYAVAFGGEDMVDLNDSELRAMARRRLGEYPINECM